MAYSNLWRCYKKSTEGRAFRAVMVETGFSLWLGSSPFFIPGHTCSSPQLEEWRLENTLQGDLGSSAS